MWRLSNCNGACPSRSVLFFCQYSGLSEDFLCELEFVSDLELSSVALDDSGRKNYFQNSF